jgi:hypothetical protein
VLHVPMALADDAMAPVPNRQDFARRHQNRVPLLLPGSSIGVVPSMLFTDDQLEHHIQSIEGSNVPWPRFGESVIV